MRAHGSLSANLIRCSIVAGAAAFALSASSVAHAQYGGGGGGGSAPRPSSQPEDEDQAKKRSRWSRPSSNDEWTEPTYTIDIRTGKKLGMAREFLTSEQFDQAEGVLSTIRESSMNPLEKAQVYQIMAYVSYGRGDTAGARDYFEKTLALGVLSPKQAADTRFQIAQLYLGEENWEKAAENLETWLTMEPNPNPGSYFMLALTYYQMQDLEKALPNAQRAVDASDDPKEPWLKLLLGLRLGNKEYKESVPILEELVKRYPKKSYWLNLATVHGALENYEEALVPLQLAYTQGLLTEGAELQRLAQLLLFLDLPYRAANVLQKGFDEGIIEPDPKAYEMLSSSYIGAREFEKAAEPLRKAANLSADGDLYIRLAQVHIQREKWQEAGDALRKGLEKGVEEPGEAQLLMGITLHSQKKPESARTWFARASQQQDTRDEAEVWIKYIDRELQSG